MRFNILFTGVFIGALLLSPLAMAAKPTEGAPKLIGTFGLWKAYAYEEKNQPVCYMALAAHFADDKKFKNRVSYLTITHRPGENSKDVVSYASGYNFKATSDVTAAIGTKSFDLFTMKDTAWSRDAATDHALSAAIRKSASVKLTGIPFGKNGAPVMDTIPLKGAAAAYASINRACGYPSEAPPAKKAKPPAAPKPAQH